MPTQFRLRLLCDDLSLFFAQLAAELF